MQVASNTTNFYEPTATAVLPTFFGKSSRSKRWAWPEAWDRISMPADEEGAELVVLECVKRLPVMLGCIRRLISAGHLKRARSLQRQLLDSHSAMIAALVKSLKKKSVKVAAPHIISNALKLSMWEFSGEPPRIMYVEKDTGGERLAVSYGPREYARQILGKFAAEPFALVSDRQFLLRGGVPAMFKWLEANLPKAKVVLTTDVPNCFLSLSRQRVEATGCFRGLFCGACCTDL